VDESEERRLDALAGYLLMDTPPEPQFDAVAFMVATLMETQVALVSLVGRDRQFYKAVHGQYGRGGSRDVSFCNICVEDRAPLVIEDATADPRVSDNPFVTASPGIRYYVGVPLMTPGGQAVGTVCAIDFEPRAAPGPDKLKALELLAEQTMRLMEIGRLARIEKQALAAEKNLAESEERFRFVIESISDFAIYTLDLEGNVTNWNAGARRLMGYATDEVVGEHFGRFYTAEQRTARAPALALQTALTHGRYEETACRVRKDGSTFWAEAVIEPLRDGDRDVVGFAKITRDVTERHEQQSHLEQLAHFDSLTGLANRTLLRTRLDGALGEEKNVSVLLIDLDGFKDVNDTLGHEAGDYILASAASRIRTVIPAGGMVARMGGDEFAVVLSELHPMQVSAVSQRLLDAFRAPFAWEGETLYIGLSIGVSSTLQIEGESTPSAVLSNADIALYAAKESRKGCCFFEPRMRQALQNRRACERDLRTAVEERQFELFYQPQVTMSDRCIFGSEALLRWHHPVQGTVAPGAFLSVLERSALAPAVGKWIIGEACRHAASMRASGFPFYRVAVNLFPAQFRAGDLVDVTTEALSAASLPPDALEIEITENILLRQDIGVMRVLEELRSLGVRIAFDDFGTGYASLSLLKAFPLTTLKIDRGFVHDVTTDLDDVAIVQAILMLGSRFGLDVVAEGVETSTQEAELLKFGCLVGQGYLYSRPAPSDAVLRLLRLDGRLGGEWAAGDGSSVH
jgi:diguanylate cyclase (GGDEF)-like protein/PAS domain S-box-containing protein